MLCSVAIEVQGLFSLFIIMHEFTGRVFAMFQVNHFRNEHHIHVYGTDVPEPVATFEQLHAEYSVDTRIMSNLQSMGFHTPTVIEMQAIPVMLHVGSHYSLIY